MNKTYQKTFSGEKNAGFTLIELLVVVLIIAILAAVAIPQYEKAVMKSRMSSLWPILKSIKDAQEVYYLANGTYTDDISKLDVAVPKGDILSGTVGGREIYSNGTCFDSLTGSGGNVPGELNIYGGVGTTCGSRSISCAFTIYFDHSDQPGVIKCRGTDPKCASVCKTFDFVTK